VPVEQDGELTTAGLLRAIREIVTPSEVVIEPDINVVAAELTRDIESPSRKAKLETVVRLRSRLNPTIRKKLILALNNAKGDFGHFAADEAIQILVREHGCTFGIKTTMEQLCHLLRESP